MTTLSVEVNGRAYMVGCEDGQEAHVEALARQFDAQVREVSDAVGQVGELRLFLMAALMTADELADVKARLAQAEENQDGFDGARAAAETRAAEALDAAAQRIEALAARVG
ncbi:MAG TPA: cell division protein ZapA [Caulobacteraceae bacterium]|jgi:cell division protein ZapA|nr:cell division protein ZapA [Caulobacteraceae bacterium]